jgi:serine/threonine-protein kinase
LENLINQTLGPYQIKEKIGQGGMAYVFRAYHPALDRYVAIKVLSPALANEPGFTERFKREARAVARMNHPNILQVHDFGVEDNYHYIVMRYVEGAVTLHTLMQRNEPVDKSIGYILQMADALNYAHQQGIIHRDVKPSNILIDNQWALLSDFGLILDTSAGNDRLTETGRGIGTAAYISPEQAKGDPVDRRTDIYALGVILYEVLTGTIPHNAPTPLAVVARRVTEPVQPLRQFRPDISKSMETATLRALVRDPNYRYNDALEFSESVKKAQTNPGSPHDGLLTTQSIPLPSGVTAAPTEIHPPLFIPDRPKRLGLVVGSSIAVILLIGLSFWNFRLTSGSGQDPVSSATATLPNRATVTPVALIEPTLSSKSAQPALPPGPNPTTMPVVVANINVQVRNGPDDLYELLGYLPAGTQAAIAGRDESGQWWRIRTILGTAGYGWVRADAEQAEARAADSVPIAVGPPLPTFTSTATPLPPTPTRTPSVINTPEPTVTEAPTATATATIDTGAGTGDSASLATIAPPALPTGEFTLLDPLSLTQPTYGPTNFEWRWNGPVPDNYGFEVRVWRDGEAPAGVHDAVLDNKAGVIQSLGDNTYRLMADITDAPGVRKQRGEYNWTVVLVQIDPDYKDLGIQGAPGRLRYEPPFSGDSGGGGGNSPNNGGGSLN